MALSNIIKSYLSFPVELITIVGLLVIAMIGEIKIIESIIKKN